MSPAFRDSFVANAPDSVRKVHELDAEALVQQRKLEDDEADRNPKGGRRLPGEGANTSVGHRGNTVEAVTTAGYGGSGGAGRCLGHRGHDREVAAAEKAARALEASRRS